MQPAPYFDDAADGPEGGRAHWLTAQDGLRLRIVYWGGGNKGTVLICPGRTEYAEKYGRSARDLLARGYSSLAIDWRGQGLADRLLDDPRKGHVSRFTDYQYDLDAVMTALPELGIGPERLFLIGHSMGGCIGLRALMQGLPVRAAMFSAPMWGLTIPKPARALAHLLVKLGLSASYSPGHKGPHCQSGSDPFDGNKLTNDLDMHNYMQGQMAAHPELMLGAPTLGWASQAFIEMTELETRPAPQIPAIAFTGSDEQIVLNASVNTRMAGWPGGRLHEFPGGRHEVMMDTPQVRQTLFDQTCALFDAS